MLRFSRNRSIRHFYYNIYATVLEQIGKIKDLGVILNARLMYTFQVNDLVAWANKMLDLLNARVSFMT